MAHRNKVLACVAGGFGGVYRLPSLRRRSREDETVILLVASPSPLVPRYETPPKIPNKTASFAG